MSSSSRKCVRASALSLVAALVLAGCGGGEAGQVVEVRPVDTTPPPDVRPVTSLEELVGRTVDNAQAVSVAKATVWTVKRTSAEPVFGIRAIGPDEEVYVIALEGKFRWIAPAPPGAIVPDFVDVLMSMVSVATGAGLGGGTRPDAAAMLRGALGPGTDVPVVHTT